MFFKHFLGSNGANWKAFLTTTVWMRRWWCTCWRSWRGRDGIINDGPSPASLDQLCGYQNCQVFVVWQSQVSSLVSSVELKIVAEVRPMSVFISQNRVTTTSNGRCDCSYCDISKPGKKSKVESPLTSIKNVAPGILILAFFPFFLSSYRCLCWNPTPQKDVLLMLNSKYFFIEYSCAWLHSLSGLLKPYTPFTKRRVKYSGTVRLPRSLNSLVSAKEGQSIESVWWPLLYLWNKINVLACLPVSPH